MCSHTIINIPPQFKLCLKLAFVSKFQGWFLWCVGLSLHMDSRKETVKTLSCATAVVVIGCVHHKAMKSSRKHCAGFIHLPSQQFLTVKEKNATTQHEALVAHI